MELLHKKGLSMIIYKYKKGSQFLNDYFYCARPWTLIFPFSGYLLGLGITCKQGYSFMVVPFIVSVLMVSNLIYLANLVNTHFDYQTTKLPKELYGFNAKDIPNFIFLSFILSIFFFFLVMCFSPHRNIFSSIQFVFCFLSMVFFSYAYTSPPFAFKYKALGEVTLFPYLLVIPTCYFSQTGLLWDREILEYSTVFFIYCLTPLHANNHRDRESDIKYGIITISNILGEKLSYYLFFLYQFVALSFIVHLSMKYHNKLLLLPLFGIPSIWNLFCETKTGQYDAFDVQSAFLLFKMLILLSIGLILG